MRPNLPLLLAVLLALACGRAAPGEQRAGSEQAPALAATASPASATPSGSSPASPASSSTASAAVDAAWSAINLRACGLSLRHPPGYLVASNRIGAERLREVELLEDLPGTRDQLAGKGPPGEPLLRLHFASHAVAKDVDPVHWLRTRPGPKVQPSAIRRTTIAGLPALFYRAKDGEARVDGVVWSCPGRIVEARAPFYTPDDPLRREFARILTMVQVQGALVENPVHCEPPGLSCPSPQLSLCVTDGQWACRSLDP